MISIQFITQPNCAPCIEFKPKVVSYAESRSVSFSEMDVSTYDPGFLTDNNIVSTPTLLLVRDGLVEKVLSGSKILSGIEEGGVIDVILDQSGNQNKSAINFLTVGTLLLLGLIISRQ